MFKKLGAVLVVGVASALAAACSAGPEGDASSTESSAFEVLHGNNIHAVRNEASHGGSSGNLSDHGGLVKPTFKYYVIYWGSGFEATTQSLYTSFLSGLGQSSYWTINTQYMRGGGNSASYGASYDDTSTPPSTVTDADLQAEVHKVLAGGHLTVDPNGIYFVITPKTVKVCSGSSCSCSNFCGYHSNYTDSSYGTVLYSTIPSAAACPASCGVFAGDSTSPNGNVEADEGVSILAHEAEETQSDALGSAWYDRRGYENADKCAYKYGPTTIGGNGAKVNQSIGGKQWLVQMNWSNQISGCAQQNATDGPYTQ